MTEHAPRKTISTDERPVVIDLWKEVLGLAEADLDRGFADLGGTSLVANQFVARVMQQLGVQIPVIRVFEYPTLRLLLRYLVEGPGVVATPSSSTGESSSRSGEPIRSPDTTIGSGRDIAIIGMACRFPGARDLDEFWANLLDGRDTITMLKDDQLSPEVPQELRDDPRYVRAAGLIDEPYAMDAEFFGINPMEAKLTDPQQRVLLETAWQALEHAGEGIGRMSERCAVYAGTEDNSYYKAEIMPFPEAEKRVGRFAIMTGNEKDYVAMRIAHKLNLKGPAVSVHTACSTSLVAVIMACKSLRHGECDVALAGGASVHFPTPEGYYFQEGGVFSSDGHCRPFDEAAEGTNFTDGSGMVVLKRLDDALRDQNTIFAVIKGGAINSDGGDKVSFSAPSVAGQADCIRAALADAQVDAGTLQYLEAHGTATPVGDPIELEGLRQAFASRHDTTRLQYCGLGSVKSNIGHTTAAAGVASLIKTALALRHNVIPATVHFRRPNPHLELERSPFFIVDRKLDWPRGEPRRRAGVSSFGIGGTNSHVILEEAPAQSAPEPQAERPFEIWPVSAKSPGARDRLVTGLQEERYWPRDVAHTLQYGRAVFRHRGARVRLTQLPVDDLLIQPPHGALEDPRPVFMFPGQGAQYIGMGRSLFEQIPEFRATFLECCDVLSQHMGLDFRAFIFDPANQETLENTRYTQPALFAIEVSLGRMLLDWGIRPAFMLGHSVGEFAAAHLAGVFALEDALQLIVARGGLMADLPRGRMLSARGPLDAVLTAAGEPVDVASVNGPVHCVLAGENEQIARVEARLEAAGIPCRALHTSHAFHSAMMNPVVQPFLEAVRRVQLHAPELPIISTVTGEAMTAAEATDPSYWAHHLRSTVRFSPALFRSMALGGNIFLEVGPRTTLSSLAVQHFAKAPKPHGELVAVSMLGDQPDPQSEIGGLGSALAKIWCAGMDISWDGIWAGGRKVPLASTYPFERKDFRFSEGRQTQRTLVASTLEEGEAVQAVHSGASAAPGLSEVSNQPDGENGPGLAERLGTELAALFSDYSGLAVERLDASFVECGFDSLVLMQIGVELGKRYGVSVALRDLMERQNTLLLLARHLAERAPPDKVRHLSAAPRAPGPVAPVSEVSGTTARLTAQLATAVRSPLSVAQRETPGAPLSVEVAQALHGELSAIRDFIEDHLGPLEKIARGEAPGAQASTRARSAPEEEMAAAAVNAKPPSTGHSVRGTPLLRARHRLPPQPGAFRAAPKDGHEAWYVFDTERRCYELVKE